MEVEYGKFHVKFHGNSHSGIQGGFPTAFLAKSDELLDETNTTYDQGNCWYVLRTDNAENFGSKAGKKPSSCTTTDMASQGMPITPRCSAVQMEQIVHAY